MDHHRDILGHKEEEIKRMINREYAVHFKKSGRREGYVQKLNIYSQDASMFGGNGFKQRFDI